MRYQLNKVKLTRHCNNDKSFFSGMVKQEIKDFHKTWLPDGIALNTTYRAG